MVSDANTNAYGIYIKGAADTDDVTISGNFAVTQTANPVVTASGNTTGQAYIYANEGASEVTFTGGARLITGIFPTGASPTTMFGIYSALDGASYAFGSATGKTIFDAGTAANDTAGAAYTGMIINNNTTLAGNIDVIGQAGGTATAAGKNGGDTIGISIDATEKRTITANALVLSVKGGAGSNGHTSASDPKGIGGSATGLSIAGNKGVDIAGAIRLNLAAGADGAQGTTPTDPKVKTLTAIDNKMTTDAGVLTFKSGSSLTVKNAVVNDVHGIYNGIANVVYNFGSGEAKTVFEAVGTKTNSSTGGGKGADAIGLNLAQAATLSGNLVFTSIQGQDGEANSSGAGGAGGAATGITLADGQNIALNNANIIFTAIAGGAGGDKTGGTGNGGNGGNAVGISLASGSTSITGTGSLTFSELGLGEAGTGDSAGDPGNAYIISNVGNGTLTLGGGIKIKTGAGTTTSGTINNDIANAKYVFGSGNAGAPGTQINKASQGLVLAANAEATGKLSVTNDLEAGTAGTANARQENVTGLVIAGSTDAGHKLSTLNLSVSSTNGNAIAVALQGSDTNTAKDLKIDSITLNTADSLSAKNTEANKAIALSNTGNTNFTGVVTLGGTAFNATNTKTQKIVLDNQGTLSFASAKALTAGSATSVSANSYAIFAGIGGAQYNFGTSTSFADITNTTAASAGTKGADAAAIYVGANSTISGNASFAAFAGQAGEATTGVGAAWKKGGDAYGIASSTASDVVLTLKDANLSFGKITGGKGEKSTGATGGVGGDAMGIYLGTDSSSNTSGNLAISGSGTITFAEFEGGVPGENTGTPASSGHEYVINNTTSTKTLTLSGVSVVAGSLPETGAPESGSYRIYNNDSTAQYLFGSKNDGGTVLKNNAITSGAGNDFTGMIIAANATLNGVLKVEGQNAVGQVTALRNQTNAPAAGTGYQGSNVVAIEVGDATLTLDGFTLVANGGNGSNGAAATNIAGKGGDVYGIKTLSGVTSYITAKNSSSISATAGSAGTTGTDASKKQHGNAYGLYTEGNLVLIGANELTLKASSSGNAYGLYLGGDKNATQSNTIQLGTDGLTFADTTNGAIQGDNAYGIYNKGNNILTGKVIFGDSSKVAVGNGNTTSSYGLYNVGVLTLNDDTNAAEIEFKDDALQQKTGAAVHIYNAGELTFGANSKAFIGTGANANLFSDASKRLEVVLDAGSTTTFNGKAFGGTGEIILTLGDKAKVVFNNDTIQDAGNQLNITSDGADILISGSDVEKRFATKAFKGRKMKAYTANFKGTNIILAASTKAQSADERLYVSDSFSLVGSSTGVEDSNLHVVVDEYGTNADKYAVLAAIDRGQNGDATITFNGLKSDNSEVETTTYSGFATAKVAIKRFDVVTGSNTISYYASNLMSTDISVNTDFVAPATAALSAGVSLFSANLNSLSKRMGELRNDPYSQGAWARVFGGEQTTNFGAKQSTVYSTVQAGYDYKLALGDAANYIGAAISYTKGMGGQVNPAIKTAPTPLDLPVAGLTSSNTDGVEVALYNSYVANSGLYSDTIAKFGYYMTDLTLPLIDDTQSTSNLAVAVSEEIGYKVSLGESNEWFITPQGEVAFAYITGSEFKQISVSQNGASVLTSTQDAVSLLRARVGAAWGYDFSYLAKESDVKASIYLGTYYAYDYFMGGDTTLSTTVGSKTVDYTHNAYEGTGRFVMNLGTNIDVQDRTKVYFDFEKSFGGNIQTDYQVSLGVRFGFGEKVSAPKQEEKKATEAALKPKELDESAE